MTNLTQQEFQDEVLNALSKIRSVSFEDHALGLKIKNGFDIWYIKFGQMCEKECHIHLYHHSLYLYRTKCTGNMQDIHLQFSKWITAHDLACYIAKHGKKYDAKKQRRPMIANYIS